MVLDGNVPGRDVGDHGGDEKRGNPLSGGVFNHFLGLPVLHLETADAGTHIYAQAIRVYVGVFSLRHQPRLLHGLPGRCHGVQREVILLADEGFIHAEALRVKVLYFAGEGDGHVFEGLYVINSADAVDEVVPESIYVRAQRGHDAHTGNDNSLRIHI